MDQQTLDTLLDRLEPLAQKLGQGAEFLWDASVRRVMLSAGGFLIFAVVLIALGLALRKAAAAELARWQGLEDAMVAKATRSVDRRYPALTRRDIEESLNGWRSPWRAASYTGWVVIALGLMPLWAAVNRLVNPGWYAIRTVFQAVGL